MSAKAASLKRTRCTRRDDDHKAIFDYVDADADGYISIVGRDKDLIISGGLNVYPKEVEGMIDDIEGVLESAVIGVPHRDFGEAVVSVVVREYQGLKAATVETALADRRTLSPPEIWHGRMLLCAKGRRSRWNTT